MPKKITSSCSEFSLGIPARSERAPEAEEVEGPVSGTEDGGHVRITYRSGSPWTGEGPKERTLPTRGTRDSRPQNKKDSLKEDLGQGRKHLKEDHCPLAPGNSREDT